MKKITLNDLETRSADVMAENLKRLKALFPEAFSEGKVDFDVLKQLLGGAVEEQEEKYVLNWHGKRQARQLALTPSTGTLRPCPEESVDWDTTQNLMIEGDNLEVLKLLQKSYAGKVKLIYIDPPYNTGKDFVYRDDYRDNIRNYLNLTGQIDGESRKLSSNTEASGRFHTDWLNMMYPRLKLARGLLRRDGVILVSIDDGEADNLRLACNEVFGEENFIARLIWEKGRKNDAKLFSIGHDYMLVYAASKAFLSEQRVRWREAKPGAREIHEEYLRLKSLHKDDTAHIQQELRAFYGALSNSHPSKKLSRYSNVDSRGVWRDDNMSWPGGGGPTYDVLHPTTKQPCKVPEGGWRYSTPEKMREMIAAGRVQFRDDHTEPPIRKTYLVSGDDGSQDDDDNNTENDDVGIQVAGTYFYRSALQASRLMLGMFGAKIFDNPKDHEVLARWISYVGDSSSGNIVLDFFAGSGTTGHALMAQNASDGGNRRYILVQLPEPLAPDNRDQKAAADFCDQIGKPRTIAELTKERLRRAGKKLREENQLFTGDLGFRVFKLDSSNIRVWEPDRNDLDGALLENIDHINPGRSEQDILYEVLLKLGLDLCVPIETRNIAGKSVRSIGAGTLIACLDEKIIREEVEPLAHGIADWYDELAPAGDNTVIFRDSAFADDIAKANLTAILEQRGLGNVRSL